MKQLRYLAERHLFGLAKAAQPSRVLNHPFIVGCMAYRASLERRSRIWLPIRMSANEVG